MTIELLPTPEALVSDLVQRAAGFCRAFGYPARVLLSPRAARRMDELIPAAMLMDRAPQSYDDGAQWWREVMLDGDPIFLVALISWHLHGELFKLEDIGPQPECEGQLDLDALPLKRGRRRRGQW